MKSILVRKGATGFILFVLMMVAAGPLTNTSVRGNDEQSGMTEQVSYSFSFAPPNLAITGSGDTSAWTDPLLVHITNVSLNISIRGGLGVTVKITNTGDEDINLTSSGITLTGHFFFDRSFSGMPAVLRAGKSMWDKEFLGGFGSITIGVNVTCADGTIAQKNATGFLLGVFVFGMK